MPVRGGGGLAAALLETGQTTAYSVFDDGDQELGVDKSYTIIATAGNTNIEVAHYSANTISFTAPNTVASAAGQFATILTGDRIRIKGTVLNDGTYDVLVGGVAASFTTVQNTIVNEAAASFIWLYKVTAHSNIVVQDTKTDRMWSQTTSNGERVGVLSNGTLAWSGVAWLIYNVANTLQMVMPGNILRIIGGAARVKEYNPWDMIYCVGFANPVNNLPMFVVSSTVNGANLDLVLNPGNQTLIAEGPVGDQIVACTRSIFNYMAGARLAGLSGYTDWRVPNEKETDSLLDHEAPTAYPDPVSFPAWPDYIWTATTYTFATTFAMYYRYDRPLPNAVSKTAAYITALVRS